MSDIEATIDKLMPIDDTISEGSSEEPDNPSVIDKVPDKEELITMSASALTELKDKIVAETTQAIMESEDFRERLRLQLEQASALRTVDKQGQFSDPGVKMVQSGSLGPIDHQEAVVGPYKTDKLMKYRVINNHDDTLNALRRYQGWKPVLDVDGHEVRYMDGTLAEMPKIKYDETVGAHIQANKLLRSQTQTGRAEKFAEEGAKDGLQTFGDGLKLDK